ncbi:MAG TPA: transcription antitermination factor NusB [Acidimicrobiales bacterium]|nr:transcription antitermination factor NusB [Acidimicrobiales bacterium]
MSDLQPSDVELRRAARERALELLYEAEAKAIDVDDVVGALPLPPDPLALELVRGVAAHRSEIDEMLTRRVAPRWSLKRLAAVDRAILRLGTYELLGAPDRSQAVIINEAVVLARRFGTDDSPRFVNGVLAAVADEVRPTEVKDEPPEPTSLPPGDREVDAVIIDLDGVIRHWQEDDVPAAEQELGLPKRSISGAAFEPDRLERAMRGELTAEEWYAEVGDAVAAAHGGDAAAVAKAFEEVGWRIDESVLDLLDWVRDTTGVPVVLLSNASTRLIPDLLVSGMTSHFNEIVGSADIGVTKPDARAFEAAADAAGVPVERCVLVDDTPANVAAAAALGMRTIAFDGPGLLEDELRRLGLLPVVDHGG